MKRLKITFKFQSFFDHIADHWHTNKSLISLLFLGSRPFEKKITTELSHNVRIRHFIMSSGTQQRWVVGVAGVSGCGKTTLVNTLDAESLFPKSITVDVVHQDDYYLDHDEPYSEATNWEDPGLLDNERLCQDINTWRRKTSSTPALLLVEGFLVCAVERVRRDLDYCLFLRVPRETSHQRRFQRDPWIREHPEYFDVVWNSYEHAHQQYPLSYIDSEVDHARPCREVYTTQPPLLLLEADTADPVQLAHMAAQTICSRFDLN